jgi:hypothetical protein
MLRGPTTGGIMTTEPSAEALITQWTMRFGTPPSGIAKLIRACNDAAYRRGIEDATSDAVLEGAARAACRAFYYCDLDKPDGLEHWQHTQERYRTETRAALKAARESALAPPQEGSS